MTPDFSLAWIGPSTEEGVNHHVVTTDAQPTSAEIERLHVIGQGVAHSETSIVFKVLRDAWMTLDGLTDLLGGNFEGASDKFRLQHDQMTTRLLSAVGAFLTSARMYIDGSKSVLSSQFSQDSDEYRGFVRDSNVCYGSRPGYRFTERLRNIVLHMGVIPARLKLSKDVDPARSCIVADREDCLDSKYGFNAKVRQDIIAWSEEFDLKPLLAEAFEGYRWIELRRSMRVSSGLRDDLMWTKQVLSRCAVPSTKSPMLISMAPMSGSNNLTATTRPLPSLDQIDKILEALNLEDAELFLERLSGSGIQFEEDPGEAQLSQHRGQILAADVMDRWHKQTPNYAQDLISDIVDAGPEDCYLTLLGFMEFTAITLLEIHMITGRGMGEFISAHRGQVRQVNRSREKT